MSDSGGREAQNPLIGAFFDWTRNQADLQPIARVYDSDVPTLVASFRFPYGHFDIWFDLF